MNRSVRFQTSASAALVTATVVLAAGFVSPVAGAQASGPVLEEITVSARKREESLIDVPLTITVLDESGRVVARKPLQNGHATLTTADLADGLYIYRITGTDREVATGRFMVSHLW